MTEGFVEQTCNYSARETANGTVDVVDLTKWGDNEKS
jgi:hypothetical protein